MNYSGLMSERVAPAFGQRITCMTAHTRGILAGGENGHIWVYEIVQTDHINPCRLLHTNNSIRLAYENSSFIADVD
jgi:hypothetical protein